MGFRDIRSSARKLADNRNWMVATAQVAAVVVFPLIEGVALRYRPAFEKEGGEWFWVVFIGISIIHVGFAFFVYASSRNESFYFEYEDVCDERDRLQNDLDEQEEKRRQAEWVQEIAALTLSTVQQYQVYASKRSDLQADEVRTWIKRILAAAIRQRSEVFSFTSQARYNFSVYLYDRNDQHLKPFYRKVDSRIITSNRTWEVGRGHIGICYAQQRAIVSEDVLEAPMLDHDLTDSDRRNYRSMASAPIRVLQSSPDDGSSAESPDEDTSSVEELDYGGGVLIITSSEPNQLTEEKHETAVLMLAGMLALVLDDAWSRLQQDETYV